MTTRPRLSPLVRRALALLLPEPDCRTLVSELEEGWEVRAATKGPEAARAWLRREGRRAVYHALAARVARPGFGRPSGVLGDIRYALRRLLRAPTFTVTVVFSLAVGIGGTTAVFSLVHAVLIQPLPYPDADELVQIYTDIPGQSWGFSMVDADALVAQQSAFEELAFLWARSALLDTPQGGQLIRVRRVTPSFFAVADIRPAAGRGLIEADVAPDAEAVALVSWSLWQGRFGGDPAIVGRTIVVDGAPVTVAGVMPRDVDPLTDGFDVVTPLAVRTPARKGPFGILAVGRVREEMRPTAAAELAAIEDRIFPLWESSWPRPEATWVMRDLKAQVVGSSGSVLWVILGAVGLLLLIACANTSNLLVARGLARRREITIRAALGASRHRILRHVLAESAVLTVVGSLAALGVAFVGVEVVTTYGSDFIPRIQEVDFTRPVALFFAGVTAMAAVLFGLLPAVQVSGETRAATLGSWMRGSTADRDTWRLRRALVVSEFAIAAPLLVGAGLLMMSLAGLQGVDPGFDARRTLTTRIILPSARFASADTSEVRAAWADLTARLGRLPGVASVGIGTGRPPDRPAFGNNFVLEDRPLSAQEAQPATPWVIAEPGYFHALQLDVVQGRMFDGERDPPRVALVDERWARRFYPGESAVGRRFRHGACTLPSCPAWTVLGVVEDVRYTGLDDAGEGTVYMNFQRWGESDAFLIVRSDEPHPAALLAPVRRAIQDEVPGAALVEPATGEQLLVDTLEEPRYLGTLVAIFASLALVLALVGIYGTMAYFVRQQRKGIGIRLALGSRSHAVAGSVVGQGVGLSVVGTFAGLAVGIGLAHALENVLFGIRPTDIRTYGAVAVLLLAAAALASSGPALLAARTDPADTLRED